MTKFKRNKNKGLGLLIAALSLVLLILGCSTAYIAPDVEAQASGSTQFSDNSIPMTDEELMALLPSGSLYLAKGENNEVIIRNQEGFLTAATSINTGTYFIYNSIVFQTINWYSPASSGFPGEVAGQGWYPFSCLYLNWLPAKYEEGTVVKHNSKYYISEGNNIVNEPGIADDWVEIEPVGDNDFYSYSEIPGLKNFSDPKPGAIVYKGTQGDPEAWLPTKIYDTDDEVNYNGLRYRAKWWTKGAAPDENCGPSDVWELVEVPPVDPDEWDADTQYVADDEVLYDGVRYIAKRSTQGEQPDENCGTDGAWEVVEDTPVEPDEWDANKIYLEGDEVTYNGLRYRAKWWTQNSTPGLANGPWELVVVAPVDPDEWDADTQYVADDEVLYDGVKYIARRSTQGEQPDENCGTDGAWEVVEDTPDEWDANKVYLEGDEVTYNGLRYRAKWYAQGSTPGLEYGPWELVLD